MTARWVESEEQFTAKVIETAMLNQWHVQHVRPGRMSDGRWRTHIQGHIGGPDLLLARDGVVLCRELKSEVGYLKPQQKAWMAALGDYGAVWRPSDWDLVLSTLTRKVLL